jgi:hypothetical protein
MSSISLEISEGAFAGPGFGPGINRPAGQAIGGLAAGIDPGLQDELDKLVKKLRRGQLRRHRMIRRALPRTGNKALDVLNAVLAARAIAAVRSY